VRGARHVLARAVIQRKHLLGRIGNGAAVGTGREMSFDFFAPRRVEFAVQKTGQLRDQGAARF